MTQTEKEPREEKWLREAKVAEAVAAAVNKRGSVRYDPDIARIVGRDFLREELEKGDVKFPMPEPCQLSDEVRDALLTHTRQDVAMSFSVLDGIPGRIDAQQKMTRELIRVTWILLVAIMALAAWMLGR